MSTYYEGLPIYRSAADVVVYIDRVVREFPRYHKYALGARLRDVSIDITLLVARANRREDREQFLPLLCERIEELKLLVNLGKEVGAFKSFKQFVEITEQVVSLARQAEGWRKSSRRQRGPEPGASPAARRAT